MSTHTAVAPFETKASNTRERTFEGLASTFGNIDFGGDTVVPGAFTKTLAEWRSSGRSLPLLDQHDYSSVVRTRLGKLVDARETSEGLWVKFKVFRTRAGDDLVAMLEDEGVDGLSIGYQVEDSEPITIGSKSARALKTVSLREISAVHWGMDPHALINTQSVKRSTYTEGSTSGKTDALGWSLSGATSAGGFDPARSAALESRLRNIQMRGLKSTSVELETRLNTLRLRSRIGAVLAKR